MKRQSRKITKMVLVPGILLLLISTLSFAQEFPTRPINMLAAIGAGSPQDVTTRVLLSKA